MEQKLPSSVSSSATDASVRLEAHHLHSQPKKQAGLCSWGPRADGDINPAVSGRRAWASISERLRRGVLGGELQTSYPLTP